jgi:hypothetical protein
MIQSGELGCDLLGSITHTIRVPSNANEHRDADYPVRGFPLWKGATEECDTGDPHPKPEEKLRARHVVGQSV